MKQRERHLHALERHIDRLGRHIQAMQQRSEQIIGWRVGAFFAGLIAIFLALQVSDTAGLIAFIGAVIVFLALVGVHNRVKRSITRFQTWQTIKRDHLARMRINWAVLPENVATARPEHPFARDIDIVGDYSLHRLLDTTISLGGSERLLNWLLLTRPNAATIAERQQVITELKPLTAFRDGLRGEAMIAAGKKSGSKWDETPLITWLNDDSAVLKVGPGVVILLSVLAALNIGLGVLYSLDALPPLWLGTFVVFVAISGWMWSRMGDLFSQSMRLQSALARLRAVLAYLETYPYQRYPHLQAVSAPLTESGEPPSRQIRRISRIVTAVSVRGNPILWLIFNLLLPWDVFFAYWLARSRGTLAVDVPRWLDAWYEVEALSALATFAYLNPAYVLPQIDEQPMLNGQALGHPLIPHEERINNDFTLDALGQVVIITGSNMSGKSSFLRTLGVSLALTYSGSVVDASAFTVGQFRLFSCIRVTDSVVDGISYFYAEVKRLKALLAALKEDDPMPLFFLIDEIFRGTNNRERLIGSRSFIKSLTGGRGMGLISTHDLELVNLADENAAISNYHFREHIIDDRMAFDYQLREGPSPTTNALRIMELEGLPVDELPRD